MADQPVDFRGLWHNQHKSRLEIQDVAGDGRITGRFRTEVGACSQDWVPVTGFVYDDIISFTANFSACGRSFTAWVGQVVDEGGTERLYTQWLLSFDQPNDDEQEGSWNSILAGCDVFSRGEPPANLRAPKKAPSVPVSRRRR